MQGVSLLVREDGSIGMEEVKVWGPNILSFELHVGQEKENRWHYMEGYLSNKEGKAQHLLTAAIRVQTEGARLIVLADLNANLDSP